MRIENLTGGQYYLNAEIMCQASETLKIEGF